MAPAYITGIDDAWGWLRGGSALDEAENVAVGAELRFCGGGDVLGEGPVDESRED